MPRLEYRAKVAADIRSVFHAPDLAHAQLRLEEIVAKWREKSVKLADWMEANLPEGGFSLHSTIPFHLRRYFGAVLGQPYMPIIFDQRRRASVENPCPPQAYDQ